LIRGIITDEREAWIRLTVHGRQHVEHEIDAIVDTGYDGYLTLPARLIAGLGLAWRRRGRAELADGDNIGFNVYSATVVWDGRNHRVEVDAANTFPLVGMAMLEGYELTMRIRSGGEVLIAPLQ
jgi:clan AA aspartic protease